MCMAMSEMTITWQKKLREFMWIILIGWNSQISILCMTKHFHTFKSIRYLPSLWFSQFVCFIELHSKSNFIFCLVDIGEGTIQNSNNLNPFLIISKYCKIFWINIFNIGSQIMFDQAKMGFFFGKSKTCFKTFEQYQCECQKILYSKNDSKSIKINFRKIIFWKNRIYWKQLPWWH